MVLMALMAPTPLTTRLALKPGKRMLIVHAPEGHIETDVKPQRRA